ncbi:oxalurate catabolism protein HpxZ [Vannielia litorea]|uniref:oxalurate catabolism protein HpxZ n=1 Tax=Vannielia litorea TaxID=1217970 RepID=UPI001C96FE5A|nr:oxalurate catabolism protein HpxZ [Vannielia litorea]MBY6153771.1 oxalurate catabolism protein HpxZ [Vannielia litorea]
MTDPVVNDPETLAEVEAAFTRYERALTGNLIEEMDDLFWHHGLTVRLGAGENLYGIEAIRAFRKARPSKGLERALRNTVITSFGKDFATACTEFTRDGSDRIGRQTHSWVRFEDGWKIVAAHVSLMEGGQ